MPLHPVSFGSTDTQGVSQQGGSCPRHTPAARKAVRVSCVDAKWKNIIEIIRRIVSKSVLITKKVPEDQRVQRPSIHSVGVCLVPLVRAKLLT